MNRGSRHCETENDLWQSSFNEAPIHESGKSALLAAPGTAAAQLQ